MSWESGACGRSSHHIDALATRGSDISSSPFLLFIILFRVQVTHPCLLSESDSKERKAQQLFDEILNECGTLSAAARPAEIERFQARLHVLGCGQG